jgi:hypothetical protein
MVGMRGLVAVVVVAILGTGCLSVGVATRGDRPIAQPVFGGLIGDLAIGAGGSHLYGNITNADDTSPYFWTAIGTLVAVDAVAAAILYVAVFRTSVPAAPAADGSRPKRRTLATCVDHRRSSTNESRCREPYAD